MGPFREFQDLYERMGRRWQSAVPGGGGLAGEAWAPWADLEETDDAYLLEVDLPGVKKNDITVALKPAVPVRRRRRRRCHLG